MLRHIKTIRKPFKKPPGPDTIIFIDTAKTLAGNPLAVRETWQPTGTRATLAKIAAQAINRANHQTSEPLDAALATFAKEQQAVAPSHPPLRVLPFDHASGVSGNLWHNGSEYVLAVKGAPESILARCDLTESERERASIQLHKLAGEGYRVVALAHRPLSRQITAFGDLTAKEKLEFGGFLAVASTMPAATRLAVKAAATSRASLYLVTGDHPEAARRFGLETAIVRPGGQAFDARRLDVMSDEQAEKLAGELRIFARATPAHKRRILKLLQKRGTVLTPSSPEELRSYFHR